MGEDPDATCHTVINSSMCVDYHSAEASALRFLCPVSCDCGTLFGGMRVDSVSWCPDGFGDLLEEAKQSLPCADDDVNLRNVLALRHSTYGPNASCAEVTSSEPWRCQVTSVAAFCPVSCNCLQKGHSLCPASC